MYPSAPPLQTTAPGPLSMDVDDSVQQGFTPHPFAHPGRGPTSLPLHQNIQPQTLLSSHNLQGQAHFEGGSMPQPIPPNSSLHNTQGRAHFEGGSVPQPIPPNPSFHSIRDQAHFEGGSVPQPIPPNPSFHNIRGQAHFAGHSTFPQEPPSLFHHLPGQAQDPTQFQDDSTQFQDDSTQFEDDSTLFIPPHLYYTGSDLLGQQDAHPLHTTDVSLGSPSWSQWLRANMTENVESGNALPLTPSTPSEARFRSESVRSSGRGPECRQIGSFAPQVPARSSRLIPYKRRGSSTTGALVVQARQGRKASSKSAKGKNRMEAPPEPSGNDDGGIPVLNLRNPSIVSMVHAVGSPGGLSARHSLLRREPKFLNLLNVNYGPPIELNLKSDRRIVPTAVHAYEELIIESDTPYIVNTRGEGSSPNQARSLLAIKIAFIRLALLREYQMARPLLPEWVY